MSASLPASVRFAPTTTFLGEIVSWEFPTGLALRHADLVAALTAAGLDPAAARTLHSRCAFIRAIHRLSGQSESRIARNLEETNATLTYQFTQEVRGGDRLVYLFECKVTLDKATGAVSATDPGIEAQIVAELASCAERRTVTDLTRLLKSLFARNADLFPIKTSSGVYFVPQPYTPFVAQVETFVQQLHGSLCRFPVPEGTPQGNQSVAAAVRDGIEGRIQDYEEAVLAIRQDTSDAALTRAWASISEARDRIESYRSYLGSHATILEDHVALVQHLLLDREAQRAGGLLCTA